jgi:ankyrin repeat protein
LAIDIPHDAVSLCVCTTLVAAGADLLARNNSGLTCIDYAKLKHKSHLTDMLLVLAQLRLRE